MNKPLALLAFVICLCCSPLANAETFDVLHRQHQPEDKAHKIEKANIYIIQCSSTPGEKFYIYQYFRNEDRPNFRAILPPNWGAPIGGMDYWTFEQAVCAACADGEVSLQPSSEDSSPAQDGPKTSIILD